MAKLSDFNLEKCLYMSVGSHAGETIEQIIWRKKKEIELCGWSLWAFSSPIAKHLIELCKKYDELNVIMPVTGEATVGNPIIAKNYFDVISGELHPIPDKMKVAYSGNQGYALVVDEYFFIEEVDNILYKNNYTRIKYFNGVELLELNGLSKNTNKKKIKIVAKLRKPFIVSLN